MTIVVNLSPEAEAQLRRKAARQGQDISIVASQLLEGVRHQQIMVKMRMFVVSPCPTHGDANAFGDRPFVVMNAIARSWQETWFLGYPPIFTQTYPRFQSETGNEIIEALPLVVIIE